MVEKLGDVWESRDFPVLVEVVRRVDETGAAVSTADLLDALGMDLETVSRAARSLSRLGLARITDAWGGPVTAINEVSGRAYQLTGLHPNPDDRVDKLLELLDDAIAKSADEHERTALQAVRSNLGDVGKQTIAGILSALIAAYVGGIGG